jgi:hypothetical protein
VPRRGRAATASPNRGPKVEAAPTPEAAPPGGRSLSYWIVVAGLTLAPLAVLVAMVVRYSVDVPSWDQWSFVYVLRAAAAGKLTFADLWCQHNEHRLLFPRLIMVLLARVTGWDVRYEMATSIVFAAAALVVLYLLVRRTWRSLDLADAPSLLPLLAVMIFSLDQCENWLWGWQLQIPLNVLAVVSGVALLSAPELPWRRFLLALLCGVVATYSFACGLLYWPLLLPLLLARPAGEQPTRRITTLAWGGTALLVYVSYLYHYASPPASPPLLSAFHRPPGDTLRYVLNYLGAPMIHEHIAGLGAVGLALLIAVTVVLYRRGGASRQALLPYLCLAGYAVATACITALGRVGFGAQQALAQRYITFANLMWVALVVLLYLIFSQRGAAPRDRGLRTAALLTLAALALLAVRNSQAALPDFQARGEKMALLHDKLRAGVEPRELTGIVPQPETLGNEIAFLQEHHLSTFRESR